MTYTTRTTNNKYRLGLTKDPVDAPIDLMEIYKRVKRKKEESKK